MHDDLRMTRVARRDEKNLPLQGRSCQAETSDGRALPAACGCETALSMNIVLLREIRMDKRGKASGQVWERQAQNRVGGPRECLTR